MSPKVYELRVQTICLIVLAAAALGVAAWLLSPVLVPLVLAVFFTYSLTPVADWLMQNLRVPRLLAVLVAFILGAIILLLLCTIIGSSLIQVAGHVDDYRAELGTAVERILDDLPLERVGFDAEAQTQLIERLRRPNLSPVLSGAFGVFMRVTSNGVLVLVFMIFMLMGRPADEPGPGSPGLFFREVERRIRRYLLAMTLISAATGLLVGASLSILGVRFAFLFGVLAFLLNFIPTIGSIVATLLPLPIVLLDPDMATSAKVLAIIVPTGIQFSIGNVIAPKVLGDSLDLHPVVVLIALVFFGMIWGVVGMFLATPTTAVLKILLERELFMRPIAAALGGQLGGPYPWTERPGEPPPAAADDAGDAGAVSSPARSEA